MEELNWLSKYGRQTAVEGADVLVSVSKKYGHGSGKIYLTFYEGAEKRVSDTGYIVIAIRNNRIYLKASDVSSGYTLSNSGKKGKTKIAQITVPERDYLMVKKGTGSYILFKDNNFGLYYIELKQKQL